jgi:hypothetical protein
MAARNRPEYHELLLCRRISKLVLKNLFLEEDSVAVIS